MDYYLAKMTGNDEGEIFYDLVKADDAQQARAKVEAAYGYGYEIEINIPIE